jgi:hypothetical protein
MPPPLHDWPFNQPDAQQRELLDMLVLADTRDEVRAVLTTFLVGDIALGMVDLGPRLAAPRHAAPRRRWWLW